MRGSKFLLEATMNKEKRKYYLEGSRAYSLLELVTRRMNYALFVARLNNALFLMCCFWVLNCRNDTSNNVMLTPSNKKDFSLGGVYKVKGDIKFETVAIGRESSEGANDAPKLELIDNGFAHPSVKFFPETFLTHKYWCALTPYFGIVMTDKEPAQFENPHVFFSDDGIEWNENPGVNPIDLPYPMKGSGPYWSDVNLVIDNNTMYLYYRGTNFPKGYFNDNLFNGRSVVVRTSTDGQNWSNKKLIYSSTIAKNVDHNSLMVSPCFLKSDNIWYCYDVVYSTKNNPIEPQKNQSQGFVMRRTDSSPIGNFGDYHPENICNFLNRPWGEKYDPWHIEVIKHQNMFFMLINVGLVGVSHGEALYLAYSEDGFSFKVIDQSLFENDTYKSSLIPISGDSNKINFKLYRSVKSSGKIELYDLLLNRK